MRRTDLIHVKTEDQVVDIFTKSLGRDKFTYFRELLGVMLPLKLEGEC